MEYPFLQGGGEMGRLTRTYNWSLTPIGTPDQWSQSLRTILSILLNSKIPMFLWWGTEFVQFYNDAYRPSLDQNSKHPAALGQRGAECWQETWPTIKPRIEQVLAGGEATWNEDQLIPIYRNDQLEDMYWTLNYGPVYDESGKPAGVLVTCLDTSDKVTHRFNEVAQQMSEVAANSAGIGIFRISLVTGKSEYSPVFAHLMTGNADAKNLTRERLIQYLHPDDDLRQTAVKRSFETGEFSYEPRIVWDDGSVHQIQIKGKTIYDEAKQPIAFSGTVRDVTEQRKQAKALEESELFSRSVIDHSPVAKVVFVSEKMIIKTVNQNMLAILGRDSSIVGMPFVEAMPELRDTPLSDRLQHVFATGETFYQPEEKIEFVKYGKPYTGYYNYIYKALWNTVGELYGIIVTMTEVTEQVIARQKIEEAEATLRSAIELAALGTWQIDLTTRILDYSPRLR